MFFKPFADPSNSTFVWLGGWVRSVEDPDFAKQNDCDSAARTLTNIPAMLMNRVFDVPPRLGAYGKGTDDAGHHVAVKNHQVE